MLASLWLVTRRVKIPVKGGRVRGDRTIYKIVKELLSFFKKERGDIKNSSKRRFIKKLLNNVSKRSNFLLLGIAAVILFGLIFINPGHCFAYGEEGLIEDFGNILIQGVAFLGSASPLMSEWTDSPNGSGIIIYTVQSGDTPSGIAASFGISTNTLLWANNLTSWSIIRPGDKLKILPVSGILYKVKTGDTLTKIVAKYGGDVSEIIEFNGLPADGSIQIGDEIIIPEGKMPVYSYSSVSYPSYYKGPYSGISHRFPWGQCTWYIAQKRYIPWGGNAKSWLYMAKLYGFPTGTEPQPGAIMVTSEGWYGHVAYVEAVNGNIITVSEMNLGQGIRKVRQFYKWDWRIRGYIY